MKPGRWHISEPVSKAPRKQTMHTHQAAHRVYKGRERRRGACLCTYVPCSLRRRLTRLEQALPHSSGSLHPLQGKSLGTGVCERGTARGLFPAPSPPAPPASLPSAPPTSNPHPHSGPLNTILRCRLGRRHPRRAWFGSLSH